MNRLRCVFIILCTVCLCHLANASNFSVQAGPLGEVRAVALSPNGKKLAVLSEKTVQVWTRDGEVLWTQFLEGKSHEVVWNQDGSAVAAGFGGVYGMISARTKTAGFVVFDAATGAIRQKYFFGNNTITSLAFLPDGNLSVSSSDGIVEVDKNGKVQEKGQYEIPSAIFSPHGKYALKKTTGLQLWDGKLQGKIASLWKKNMPVSAVAWSADEKRIATTDGRTLQIWNAESHEMEKEIVLLSQKAPKYSAVYDSTSVVWRNDSAVMVAKTDFPDYKVDNDPQWNVGKSRCFLWNVDCNSGVKQMLLRKENYGINTLGIWPDGTLVIGGEEGDDPQTWEGTLSYVHIENDALKTVWSAPPALPQIRRIDLSADGKTLAVAGDDTAVFLWNVQKGTMKKRLKVYSSKLMAIAWAPSGKKLAALDPYDLIVYDVGTDDAKTFEIEGYYVGQEPYISLDWSPDESHIVYNDTAGLHVLDLATEKRRKLDTPQYGSAVRWTGQGIEIDGGKELIDPTTGKVLLRLDASGAASEKDYGGNTSHFQFLDKGAHLWTIGAKRYNEGSAIKLWDVHENRILHTLHQPPNPTEIALSPDEKILAIGTKGGEIVAIDAHTRQSIWQASVDAPLVSMTWSAGSDALFAAAKNGCVYVLDAAGKLRSTLISLPANKREKTGKEWINFTPESTFTSSQNASQKVRWNNNGNLLPLPQEKKRATLPLVDKLPGNTIARLKPGLARANKITESPPKPTNDESSKGLQLVLQDSSDMSFSQFAISTDARWAVTSGARGNIVLWDIKNGLRWGDWADTENIVPLHFSADAKVLLCGWVSHNAPYVDDATFQKIKAFSIPDGKLLYEKETDIRRRATWSDGHIVRAIEGDAILTMDLGSGKLLARQKIGQDILSANSSFSPNGKFFASGEYKNLHSHTARAWRVSDGKLVAKISDPKRVLGRAAISNDGALLATEGEDPNWSPPTDGPMTESAYARTFRIHIWDTKTQKVLFTYPGFYSLDGGARFMQFSADGHFLFSYGSSSPLDKYDLTTQKSVTIPPDDTEQMNPVRNILGISADATYFLASVSSGEIAVFDATTGKRIFSSPPPLMNFYDAWWSPDRAYLLTKNGILFNAKTGAILSFANLPGITQVRWEDNTVTLANNQGTQRRKIPSLELLDEWQVRKSKEDFPASYNGGVALTSDGKLAVTGNPKSTFRSNEIYVWDAKDHQTKGHFVPGEKYVPENSLLLVPEHHQIVQGAGKEMVLWDLDSLQKLRSWKDPIDPDFKPDVFGVSLQPLAVSGDGERVAARAARDDSVWIFSLHDDKKPLHLFAKARFNAQFLNDNHTLLLSATDAENNYILQEWDTNGDGKKQARQWKVSSPEFSLSKDNAKIVFINERSPSGMVIADFPEMTNQVALYANPIQKPLHQATGYDWLAVTEEGFYNASQGAQDRLRWREDNHFWPQQKSYGQYFNPQKTAQALR